LYHLLTGCPPFAGGTTYETVRLVLETDPRQPRLLNRKVDRDLSTICLKCLQKDPQRRYSSALALAEDVERWLRREPILARRTGLFIRGRKWLQRNPAAAVSLVSLAGLLAAVGVIIWKSDLIRPPPTTGIAVLPFENLSGDKANAYFVDGIQDEILTRLSKIRALRVISRTSTDKYKSRPDNLREIARQLGVANILEGSVQKASERAHINVQLIDARTDTHLWAQSYDRDLKNIFAVENEVAEEIAAALKLKFLSSANDIVRTASEDPQAYDLFLRASYAHREWFRGTGDIEESFRLLRAAIARDTKFARAYAYLSIFESQKVAQSMALDAALARDARLNAERALSLQPELPDGITAMGLIYLRVDHDYGKALEYLARAHEKQPGSDAYLVAMYFAQAALGRWNEALDTIQQAVNLNPGSSHAMVILGNAAAKTRQYNRAQDAFDRARALDPNDWGSVVEQAQLFLAQGKLENARALLAKLPKDATSSVELRWKAAFLSRDYAGALQISRESTGGEGGEKDLFIGRALTALGDRATAIRSVEEARNKTYALLATHPDSSDLRQMAARILATLGDKTNAVAEAEQAISLVPLSKDADDGLNPLETLAEVYAAFGEAEKALPLLRQVLKTNGSGLLLTPSLLRLDPIWDPIRPNPQFQELVASSAPK
jgi:serine/threonine-protein kinase